MEHRTSNLVYLADALDDAEHGLSLARAENDAFSVAELCKFWADEALENIHKMKHPHSPKQLCVIMWLLVYASKNAQVWALERAVNYMRKLKLEWAPPQILSRVVVKDEDPTAFVPK